MLFNMKQKGFLHRKEQKDQNPMAEQQFLGANQNLDSHSKKWEKYLLLFEGFSSLLR